MGILVGVNTTFLEEVFMKIGKIFVVLWLLAGWDTSVALAHIVWNGTSSNSWDEVTNWYGDRTEQTQGMTGWDSTSETLSSGNAYVANNGSVVRVGNLTINNNLYVGYYAHSYQGTSPDGEQIMITPSQEAQNKGTGTLDVNGDLTVKGQLYIGKHYGNEPTFLGDNIATALSLGAGVVTVSGNLTVGSLSVGEDGYASLVLDGSNQIVSIGTGTSSSFGIGNQSTYPTTNSSYFTNSPKPLQVDFSKAASVTVNVGDFCVGATLGKDQVYNTSGYYPSGSRRFRPLVQVEMGVNNTITANRLVVAGSYGSVLNYGVDSHTQDGVLGNKLVLGEGTNTLNVNKMIVGFWKAEAYKEDADGNRIPANVVSLRDGGSNTTFTLNGMAGEGSLAHLLVGYSDCSTNNVSYGMLDLTNANSVNMALDEFIIGMKLEQTVGVSQTNLLRRGGSVGVVKLGDHATVTANVLQMGYKEATNISVDEDRMTRGTLEFGGDSTVTVNHLYTGNSSNLNLIGHANINMNGGTLTVKDGVRFYDNVNFTMDGGTVVIDKIKNGTSEGSPVGDTGGNVAPAEQTDALQMYANLKLNISNQGKFTVNGSVNTNTALELGGYYDFNVNGGGNLTFNGDVHLANRLDVIVGEDSVPEGSTAIESKVEVTGKMTLQAGDVKVVGTVWGPGSSTETVEMNRMEVGTAYMHVKEGGVVKIDKGLDTKGNADIKIDGGLLDVKGDITMDATAQNYMKINLDKGTSGSDNGYTMRWNVSKNYWERLVVTDGKSDWVQATGDDVPEFEDWYTNLSNSATMSVNYGEREPSVNLAPGETLMPETVTDEETAKEYLTRKTEFHVTGDGICLLEGNLNATGELNMTTSGEGVISGENLYLKGTTETTIGGKFFQFRDVLRTGTDFINLDINGGITSFRTIGNDANESSETGDISFTGGTLSVGQMGTPTAKLNLIQSGLGTNFDPVDQNHAQKGYSYDYKTGEIDVNGKYGASIIYGDYSILDEGNIWLDLGHFGRDNITVLGKMTMSNANLIIRVEGGVPIDGFEVRGDETIAYVTLLTAEEFIGISENSFDSINIAWSGDVDESEWSYYISPLQTNSLSPTGVYELRAYRTARADEVPEPATWGMLLTGAVSLYGLRCYQKRRRG